MEISYDTGLSQSENEGLSFMQQWQTMNPTEELTNVLTLPSLPYIQSSFGPNMEQQFFNNPSTVIDFGTHAKQIEPRSSYINRSTGSTAGLNNGFGNLQPKQETLFAMNTQRDVSGSKKNTSRGVSSQAKDHIMAERRRREKISQRFIALSTLVPGLRKTDKASVLGGTIKYLKHLQERVKFLEEQTSQKTMESVVYVRKSRLSAAAETEDYAAVEEPLPEIEARFSGRSVMIRIHCEKRKGVVDTAVAEIEKLHLAIINSSLMTFGSNSIHLIVIAQMGMEFSMSPKDVVKSIKSSLDFFMKTNIF